MNIFLYAFVDENFGDALFVHTVVSRYPQHNFYMQVKKEHEKSYSLLQARENNICLVDAEDELFLNNMDAMLIVGGDLFWDYGDYSPFLKIIQKIKGNSGWVAILGISLFEKYSEKTSEDLKALFSITDFTVVRDKESFLQVKKMVPEANVILSTDMAFTIKCTQMKHSSMQKGLLGISVRKKVPRKTEEKYMQYCTEIAKIAVEYLEKSENNSISFFAFSTGNSDDRVVVKDIVEKCPKKYKNRIRCISFDKDVEGYIKELQKCEKLLCTRYHSLVFALILKKPFVPVIYEEKMNRLLNEIAYYGYRPIYEETLNFQSFYEELRKQHYLDQELKWYLAKASLFFEEIDRRLIQKKHKKKGVLAWTKGL